ncbi:MAG: hypothetical protein AAFN50_03100 [Pseudomonadota bacterium]
MFKSEPEEVQDKDKLHELYWNRAELKKEFAALRNEKYALQDRINEQKGATARVEQKLQHIESLLLDREWVYNVAVFYQLKRLNAHCHAKLGRFAEQLKQQREARVQNKVMDTWNQQRNAQASAIEKKIGEVRLQTQLLEDQLQSERHRLLTMNGFVRLFRGRSAAARIEEIAAGIESGQAAEQELLGELEQNQNRTPPDHAGLDIATKRSINFMILSFLQQLYLFFADDNLAELAREASEKSVGAVNYGSKYDCDEILERLDKRWAALEKVVDSAEILKKRAQLLANNAEFRDADDAVPVAVSLATVYAIDDNGVIREKDVNVLRDNYFGVAQVLSR